MASRGGREFGGFGGMGVSDPYNRTLRDFASFYTLSRDLSKAADYGRRLQEEMKALGQIKSQSRLEKTNSDYSRFTLGFQTILGRIGGSEGKKLDSSIRTLLSRVEKSGGANIKGGDLSRFLADFKSEISSLASSLSGVQANLIKGIENQIGKAQISATKGGISGIRGNSRKILSSANRLQSNAMIDDAAKLIAKGMKDAANSLSSQHLKNSVDKVCQQMLAAANAATTLKGKQKALAEAQDKLKVIAKSSSGADRDILDSLVKSTGANLGTLKDSISEQKANRVGLALNNGMTRMTQAIGRVFSVIGPLKRTLDLGHNIFQNFNERMNRFASSQMAIASERGGYGRQIRGSGINFTNLMSAISAGRKAGMSDRDVVNQQISLSQQLALARWGEGNLIDKAGRWGISVFGEDGRPKSAHEMNIEYSRKLRSMKDPQERLQFMTDLGISPQQYEFYRDYEKEWKMFQKVKKSGKFGTLDQARLFDESGYYAKADAYTKIEQKRQQILTQNAIDEGPVAAFKRMLNPETWFFKDWTARQRGVREAKANDAYEKLESNNFDITKLSKEERRAITDYGAADIRNGGYRAEEALKRRAELSAKTGGVIKFDSLQSPIEKLGKALTPLTEKFGNAIERGINYLSESGGALVDKLVVGLDKTTQFAKQAYDYINAALPTASEFKKNVLDFLQNPWDESKKMAYNAMDHIWNFSKDVGKKYMPEVWEAAKDAGKAILRTVWNGLKENPKLAAGSAAAGAGLLGGGIPGAVIAGTAAYLGSNLIKGSTEAKSQGGPVSRTGRVLVNEKGPELISSGGKAFVANGGKPAIVNLNSGDTVFNAEDTKRLGADGIKSPIEAAENGMNSLMPWAPDFGKLPNDDERSEAQRIALEFLSPETRDRLIRERNRRRALEDKATDEKVAQKMNMLDTTGLGSSISATDVGATRGGKSYSNTDLFADILRYAPVEELTEGMTKSGAEQFLRGRNALVNKINGGDKIEPTDMMRLIGTAATGYNSITDATLSPLVRSGLSLIGIEGDMFGYGKTVDANQIADIMGLTREQYDQFKTAMDVAVMTGGMLTGGGISAARKAGGKLSGPFRSLVGRGKATRKARKFRRVAQDARRRAKQTEVASQTDVNRYQRLAEQAEARGDSKGASEFLQKGIKAEEKGAAKVEALTQKATNAELNAKAAVSKAPPKEPAWTRMKKTGKALGTYGTGYGVLQGIYSAKDKINEFDKWVNAAEKIDKAADKLDKSAKNQEDTGKDLKNAGKNLNDAGKNLKDKQSDKTEDSITSTEKIDNDGPDEGMGPQKRPNIGLGFGRSKNWETNLDDEYWEIRSHYVQDGGKNGSGKSGTGSTGFVNNDPRFRNIPANRRLGGGDDKHFVNNDPRRGGGSSQGIRTIGGSRQTRLEDYVIGTTYAKNKASGHSKDFYPNIYRPINRTILNKEFEKVERIKQREEAARVKIELGKSRQEKLRRESNSWEDESFRLEDSMGGFHRKNGWLLSKEDYLKNVEKHAEEVGSRKNYNDVQWFQFMDEHGKHYDEYIRKRQDLDKRKVQDKQKKVAASLQKEEDDSTKRVLAGDKTAKDETIDERNDRVWKETMGKDVVGEDGKDVSKKEYLARIESRLKKSGKADIMKGQRPEGDNFATNRYQEYLAEQGQLYDDYMKYKKSREQQKKKEELEKEGYNVKGGLVESGYAMASGFRGDGFSRTSKGESATGGKDYKDVLDSASKDDVLKALKDREEAVDQASRQMQHNVSAGNAAAESAKEANSVTTSGAQNVTINMGGTTVNQNIQGEVPMDADGMKRGTASGADEITDKVAEALVGAMKSKSTY